VGRDKGHVQVGDLFEITRRDDGTIALRGRFHAAHEAEAAEVFGAATASCDVDMSGLDYISSAGLSVLLETQRRLCDDGHELVLRGLSDHILDLFRIAGLDAIFRIE